MVESAMMNESALDVQAVDNSYARNVGQRMDLTVRVMGPWYYVRKCRTGEQAGPDPIKDMKVGGLYIPEETAEWSVIVEVLAVGTGVGKRQSARWCRSMSRPRCVVPLLKPGDLAVCINKGAGIRVSPFFWDVASPWEYFIEETFVLGKLELDDEGEREQFKLNPQGSAFVNILEKVEL